MENKWTVLATIPPLFLVYGVEQLRVKNTIKVTISLYLWVFNDQLISALQKRIKCIIMYLLGVGALLRAEKWVVRKLHTWD